ncbi:MAG: AIR synthase related protein, partial [Candidatus Bathyarchaeia archaeon]
MDVGGEYITMLHGAGGSVMHELVRKYILKFFGDLESGSLEVPLKALDDAAVINGIVFKSDSHAVKPIFFPGGDIGRLAVSGTINDIAVMGAEPAALACGLILEEGLALRDLERILRSMRETCIEAGVAIVTGD